MRYFSMIAALALASGAAGCGRSSSEPDADPKIVAAIRSAGGAAASGNGASSVAVGEGWGSLQGTFVLDGAPPALGNLSTGGKDGQVCDAHPIPNESLVVDSATKGIRDVLVFARKVSRIHDDLRAVPQEPAVFDQKECVFLSHVFAVRVGQPVLVKNSDPIAHNTNIAPPADDSFNALIAGDGSATYTFKRPQADPVATVCNIHPWMKAYLFPRKDPYFAVTKADGSFAIEKLPAGEELEFQVWQERTPKGLPAKPEWSQGRFKVKIPKDEVLDLGAIAVPAALFQ